MRTLNDPFLTKSSRTLSLPDGRSLGYAEFGDPAGTPLLYFHGGGSCRLEPAYASDYAKRQGIRIIAMDRAGYGLSTPVQDRSWKRVGDDALALADALSLKHFDVAGLSAGAPYALHLAVSSTDRVQQLVLINPSVDTRNPAWQAVSARIRILVAASNLPPVLKLLGRAMRRFPQGISRRAARSQHWTPAQRENFAAMIGEGLRQPGGLDTLCQEAKQVLGGSWNLDWADLRLPALVLCGVSDPAHAFYLALSEKHPRITFTSIPGPHMPIVPEPVWKLIGQGLKCSRL